LCSSRSSCRASRRGETDGLTLLTQYNPYGLFIALESLGYFAMSVAFFFAAAVFYGGRVERASRWLFVISFVLAVAAFVWLGILGHDFVAFEVIVLTINWTVLIASGVLLSVVFRRSERSTRP
jgi:lipopolysaccharide export LptBFGC system permease protein LptF